jgi:hypothetical protein
MSVIDYSHAVREIDFSRLFKIILIMIFRPLFFVMLPGIVLGQDLTRSSADEFLRALFKGNDSLAVFVDDSALAVSNRLGITYDGVPAKFLISYDFDDALKARVRNGETHYTWSIESIARAYQRLTVATDNPAVTKEFYFRRGRLTSPFFYHAAGWKTVETTFFRFIISDSSLTNAYAMESLDRFVADMSSILAFSDDELHTLSDKKILYYLCKDEDEIERLTGYRTRGMYNLAYDAIISTYNAHYHELAHLLINDKIRSAKVYCNPFLLEGFAVAVGGRGGLSPDVVTSLGAYLDESKMLLYSELLTKDGFNAVDPSMSYPVAGLYNSFLLQSLGGREFLDLYRRHCGSSEEDAVRALSESELPNVERWKAFLENYRRRERIRADCPAIDGSPIYHNDSASVFRNGADYVFKLRSAMLLGKGDVEWRYRSKKFSELLPKITYSRDKYLITADSQSVSVHNLLTNDLIENCAASFSLPPAPVPIDSGMLCFTVPAAAFDEPMESMLFDRSYKHYDSLFVQYDNDEIREPAESHAIWLGAQLSAVSDEHPWRSSIRQFSVSLGGYAYRHVMGQYTLSYLHTPVAQTRRDEFSTQNGISTIQLGMEGKRFNSSFNSAFGYYYCLGAGLALGWGRYSDFASNPENAGTMFLCPGIEIHGGVGLSWERLRPIGATIDFIPSSTFWVTNLKGSQPLPPAIVNLSVRLGFNFSISSWGKNYWKNY